MMAKKKKSNKKSKSKKSKKTTKKKRSKKPKEEFFVSIDDSTSIRLALLEATKKALESLKMFEEIKEIKKQKKEEKENLKKQLSDMHSLIVKVRQKLPHVPRASHRDEQKEQEKEISNTNEQKPKPVRRPLSEVDRIEMELKEIEKKLSNV